MKVLRIETIHTVEEVFKKSRFITFVGKVNTKAEIDEFIKNYSKSDARHHCWAYKIGIENPVYGYHSDGEPSGTAGEPLLRLIETNDLTNIIIFCIRYFGGIKLGTGGLQRAYSSGAIQILKSIPKSSLEIGFKIKIKFKLDVIKTITTLLFNLNVEITSKEFFDDHVIFSFVLTSLEAINNLDHFCEILSSEKIYY